MTLTLNTHLTPLTQLVVHMYKLSPEAAILSEKSTVFTFSYRKACVAKFDLGVK